MLTNNANSRIACVESVSVSVNEWAVCWMKGALLVFGLSFSVEVSRTGILRQYETEKLIINYCCWKMEGGELGEITSVEYDYRIHKGYSSGRK